MITHDVLIVGGGLAGLRVAVGLAGRFDVAVLSKVHPVRSHSGAAQGGINAALGNAPEGRDDSAERHTFDTIKGSDYLADQGAAATMCRLAPDTIYELDRWGALFSRFPDGTVAQRPFGGGAFPRTCYAADRTGHVLLQTLFEQAVKREVVVYPERLVTGIAVADGRCHGLVAYDLRSGQLESYACRYCVLATGGYGRIFRNSTNALTNTGSGIGAALMAGLPIEDLEFVQFHPTTLFPSNILVTEGARGEGGHLLNRDSQRFMQRYAPAALELAPRDIMSRAIQTEINEGRGFAGGYVQLDLRHLGRKLIQQRLPGIRELCLRFSGVDPVDQPIAIQPSQHYSMGGVATDQRCRTALPNLYAVGECGCISVHGANRLGGNSLLECVVFGRVAAEDINHRGDAADLQPDPQVVGDFLTRQRDRLSRWVGRTDGVGHVPIRNALRSVMTEAAGIFRSQESLAAGVERIGQLKQQFAAVVCRTKVGTYNYELLELLELESMLHLGEIVLRGALARQESRGSHFRTDFGSRDDSAWLKHTHARLVDGQICLDYSDVDISLYEPAARTF